MKKIFKILIVSVVIIIVILAVIFVYYFVGTAPKQKNITWGVDFSQMQAESLKLNWKEVYSAIINDLGVKNIKIHTQWNWVEGKKDNYYFDDIDWQIKQAEKNNVKIIYVVGLKTGRWPECHEPSWVKELSEDNQKEELLEYIEKVVLRYKDSSAIINWQIENEPFFKFGECPDWYYKNDDLIKKEINLVKSLDSTRKIIISDSGEQSSWFKVAKLGDIVGITMYRKVWARITDKIGFNMNYFFAPVTYWRKALIIKKFFKKDVIGIELQAEPWASKLFYDVPLEEQAKTMNIKFFKENVEYAKSTGLDRFYFWGVEWWYWMKDVQNKPEIWNEAKLLFN